MKSRHYALLRTAASSSRHPVTCVRAHLRSLPFGSLAIRAHYIFSHPNDFWTTFVQSMLHLTLPEKFHDVQRWGSAIRGMIQKQFHDQNLPERPCKGVTSEQVSVAHSEPNHPSYIVDPNKVTMDQVGRPQVVLKVRHLSTCYDHISVSFEVTLTVEAPAMKSGRTDTSATPAWLKAENCLGRGAKSEEAALPSKRCSGCCCCGPLAFLFGQLQSWKPCGPSGDRCGTCP